MSHLKQIGVGLLMYAEDHQGNLPADLVQTKSYLGGGAVLDDPRKPKDFDGPSYLYVGGQSTKTDTRNIVVYENPGFCTDKINVLFLDGHVEAMKPEAFRTALKATYERLGKGMPEIKFKGEAEVQPRPPRPARPAQT
jgi:prepilin-type processing-associated H-X9-DG protein